MFKSAETVILTTIKLSNDLDKLLLSLWLFLSQEHLGVDGLIQYMPGIV
jgi:hypothetical protein